MKKFIKVLIVILLIETIIAVPAVVGVYVWGMVSFQPDVVEQHTEVVCSCEDENESKHLTAKDNLVPIRDVSEVKH